MGKRDAVLKSMLVLICLSTLAGCGKSAKEKAIKEAETAKTELAKLKVTLKKTQAERDELEQDIAAMSKELDSTTSKLDEAVEVQEQLQNLADELAQQRDTATVKIKEMEDTLAKLQEQLKQKEAEIRELVELNSELQVTVEQLQNQIDQANQTVIEELPEEPNEQGADVNSV